jgi:Putative zinc-finger
MECRDFAPRVDDGLDGRLSAADEQSMQAHRDACPRCAHAYGLAAELRVALRTLPAPALRPGFAERALAKATAVPEDALRFGRRAVASMALAASLVLGVGLAAILFALRPQALPTVVLAAQQPESVRLVFSAARPLSGATLSLSLPENVELVGYGGRRELSWKTDLSAGSNVLRLPLVVRGPAGGELVARVARGASSTTFRLRIEVRDAGGASALPAYRAST